MPLATLDSSTACTYHAPVVRLLIAPARAGKTGWCIRRAREVAADRAAGPVWIVLPDRYQVATIRGRVSLPGGDGDVLVGTFGDVYKALLEAAGRQATTAQSLSSPFIVREAIQHRLAAGALPSFAAIAQRPGFRQLVGDIIGELKRAHLRPDRFRAAGDPDERLVELAELYAETERRLNGLGWTDAEGLSWRVLDALAAGPDLAADWALVIADGFDSFEGSQLDVLAALAGRAGELVITLPGTPAMDRPAHRRFRRTLDRLTARLEGVPITFVEPAAEGAPAGRGDGAGGGQLEWLERVLFERAGAADTADAPARDDSVTLIEARSPADEAREALRWLKARIVRDGLSPGACAVITPEPERYRPHLREAAAEMGLPVRFTAGEALVSQPAMAALLDLLAVAPHFRRRLTIEALRSPFWDLSAFGLERRHAEALELVSRQAPVIEGLGQWSDALGRLAEAEVVAEGSDEDAGQVALPQGPAAAALLEALRSLALRLQPPATRPLSAWVRWLEALLVDLRFGQPATAEAAAPLDAREAAVFDRWRSALAQLHQGVVPVLGDQPLEYATFVAELRSLLAATLLDDPDVRDAGAGDGSTILALRLLDARGLRFQAVAMVGLAEGSFPQVEREDPFLDEALRARLGLDPQVGREQRGLFYLAVTRADRWLLLTRPYLAAGGQPWEPSPYWLAVRRALPNVRCLHLRPDDPRPLADAASVEELLFWAARQPPPPDALAALGPRWADLQHARQVLHARHAPTPAGPFEGEVAELQADLRVRFGPDHTWSASRLEQYGGCPLRFYAETVLDLEPAGEPAPGPNVAQLGALLHAILAATYRAAPDPADTEAVVATLGPIAGERLLAAPRRYGFRPTALWALEAAELVGQLEATVRALAEVDGDRLPVAQEVSFGRGGQPGLVLAVDGEPVRLAGVIDRVDRSAAGQLRVLDYKLGSGHQDPQDLVAGERLQLPLYAAAVRDALGLGAVDEGLYWAIKAARPGRLRLSSFAHEDDEGDFRGPEGAIDLARSHVGRILAGVRSGRFAPRPPRGGCPSYCACAAWCWRYRPERTA